jgi:hypothetical protein
VRLGVDLVGATAGEDFDDGRLDLAIEWVLAVSVCQSEAL